MISGASEQELKLANARANIIMKLDNTSTYESWLIIDTYLEQLEKENQELKNQLNKYKNRYINRLNNQLAENVEPDFEDFYLAEIEKKANDYDKYKTKQKEFIKYLEDEIKSCEAVSDLLFNANKEMKIYKQILQKFKEIIGV